MSKRKGMSADDKRGTMLSIFHESADVFQLKDIEKLSTKRGINSQTIKDVLQTLLDDDLVRMEKIGSSNYYWSYPAQASVKISNEASAAEVELAAAKRRKTELTASVDKERAGQQDAAVRAELAAELAELRRKVAAAQSEMIAYKDSDPETVQAMRQGAELAKDAANRWLDNIQAMWSWAKKQFPDKQQGLESFFEENGFSQSMEYI
mmetsp:Transcript_13883/g.24329  ORF Transcript_13883/g.24329 Transcript_13883/m.24329 type:complete len:207 (-) Transcript_13883:1095-1715(-)